MMIISRAGNQQKGI